MTVLDDALAALALLEKPRHDEENANIAYQAALRDGSPDGIAATKIALDAATAARVAANIDQRTIDAAAQAVVIARGE